MRKELVLMVAVLLVAGTTATALAWEFEMTGSWENRLRYFSRTGNNDLFGIASLQEGPTAAAGFAGTAPGAGVAAAYVGFAGPSTWGRGAVLSTNMANAAAPYQITRGGFSTWGSDAAIHDQKMTLVPTIKVNPLIRVHGVYTVGGYRNKFNQTSAGATNGVGVPPFERWYMHDSSPNAAYNTAAIGSWEQIRATFHIPWGWISVGVKDYPLGTGLANSYNKRGNALSVVVPYGPFRFISWLCLTDGLFEGYVQSPDRSRSQDQLSEGHFLTYRNGPVEIGTGVTWRLQHFFEGSGPPTGVPGTSSLGDYTEVDPMFFIKYFNGRFFANAEYNWSVAQTTYPLLGTAVSVVGFNNGATQTYYECYNALVETGVVIGPSKISLLWVQSSGYVRNNGNNVGMQAALAPGAGLNPKQYYPWAANYQVMEPYEWLIFNTYAGGNQTFHADGTGQMSDAYAFAGRYDHAVASNLNIWGTYMWAHRLEKAGTWFGQFNSVGTDVGSYASATALRALYGGTSPFVENGFIGWEVNAGVDWKLLEGLTFKTRYAYWQPGDYFKEAWRAMGVRGGTVVNNAMFLSRDAIQAIQGSIRIEF